MSNVVLHQRYSVINDCFLCVQVEPSDQLLSTIMALSDNGETGYILEVSAVCRVKCF